MRLALVCFYCLRVFVYVSYFIATMSFAGYFLSVLFCLLSMLISDSRFDLVWFRLSCDHGWIRSGSVNVRKQQHGDKCKCTVYRWLLHCLLTLSNFFSFFLFIFYLTYSRWTSSLPSCLWSQRIFPSLPGSRFTIFYRDASSALLHFVSQWLNFTFLRSHAFRYDRENTNLLW